MNILLLILLMYFGINLLVDDVSGQYNATIDAYEGPAYCLDCHPKEMVGWLLSNHSTSYTDPEFQETWEKIGSPNDCLSCHTTGYQKDNGEYAINSVSCEECHGPGNTMYVNNTVSLCAECHTGPYPTYEEWLSSGPAHGNATCYTCHDQHTTELTFDTPTETCGQCHESHVQKEATTSHASNGVQCTDCHMAFVPANFTTGEPGYTGHSFEISQAHLDCTTCHDRPLVKHDKLGSEAFACLSCHGDIHELKLELVNQTVLSLDDPVPLCAQCHNERYTAWAQGTHGQPDNPEAKCTECHDPHDPIITGISTVHAVPVREPAEEIGLFPKLIFVLAVEAMGVVVILLRRLN